MAVRMRRLPSAPLVRAQDAAGAERRCLRRAIASARLRHAARSRSGELLDALLTSFRYDEANLMLRHFVSARGTMDSDEAAVKHARLCELLRAHAHADTTRAALTSLEAMLVHQRGMHTCLTTLKCHTEALHYRHSLLLMAGEEHYPPWQALARACLGGGNACAPLACTVLHHCRRIVVCEMRRCGQHAPARGRHVRGGGSTCADTTSTRTLYGDMLRAQLDDVEHMLSVLRQRGVDTEGTTAAAAASAHSCVHAGEWGAPHAVGVATGTRHG